MTARPFQAHDKHMRKPVQQRGISFRAKATRRVDGKDVPAYQGGKK